MDSTGRSRVAVITGANRGLGLAIARALASDHCVVLTGREAASTAAAVERLREEDPDRRILPHQLDVTDTASVFRAFAEVERVFGRLDVLVNNAAVAIDRHLPAVGHDVETARATIETNLFGAWRCARAAVSLMRCGASGGYGRIVNVSSHMASLAGMTTGSPAYRISKTALNALTVQLSLETAEEDILVNAASPGVGVDTCMTYGPPSLSTEEAARTLLWLTSCPREEGPRGGYFHGRTPLPW